MPPKKKVDKKKAAEEEAARLKEEQDAKEAELLAREKAVAQRLKEAQTEEKKMKQREEELSRRNLALDSREKDISGREETIKQWMDERDEEWLAAQNGSVEMLTKKERHAILIGCNKYSDHRIRDLTHSLETVRALGVILEQLNFSCEYLHDDLPDQFLPTRQNIERLITTARQRDEILVVVFVGHAVHGALTPPRSSPTMRFVLPCNTPLEFAKDTILSADELFTMMTAHTVDINDNAFERKGLFVLDGSYCGPTHGSASTGFAYMRSTTGTELGVEYKKKQQILMSLALIRAVEGKVNVKGHLPCNEVISYCKEKLVDRLGLQQYVYNVVGEDKDFPLATRLLRPQHEIAALKELKKEEKCTFILTYTVNHDLEAHNPLLVKIVSEKLIDYCGHGVEVGKMEIVGLTDIVLDGKIQYATKVEKQQLWKDAVATFTGAPNVPFQLISGESTRPGDEGRSAVVCSIETESEDIINTMRNNYAKMTHFFGHPCIDFRQHIRVTLQGTVHQYETFNKVARKGQLDDSIFDFTGLHRAIYNIERFNNVDDEKMAQLILDSLTLIIASTDTGKAVTKRNQALGRVADLQHFHGKFRFFFYDVLEEGGLPNVTLLPGPDITNYLTTNSILLLDLKQSRNYVMLPSKAFFQGGFFPDCDIRMLCEDYLDGKLEALNHRVPGANSHPRYRLL
mmetsp:Transcript_96143/g.161587  ORF Transcript_96143/g.161587 Transcript_96143/m.161587 type:complete len:685 (-) Transcript_96143:172-2226(-)